MLQVMWPRHCVQYSPGSDFHPQLDIEGSDVIVSKGMRREVDSYSGFFDDRKVCLHVMMCIYIHTHIHTHKHAYTCIYKFAGL